MKIRVIFELGSYSLKAFCIDSQHGRVFSSSTAAASQSFATLRTLMSLTKFTTSTEIILCTLYSDSSKYRSALRALLF